MLCNIEASTIRGRQASFDGGALNERTDLLVRRSLKVRWMGWKAVAGVSMWGKEEETGAGPSDSPLASGVRRAVSESAEAAARLLWRT